VEGHDDDAAVLAVSQRWWDEIWRNGNLEVSTSCSLNRSSATSVVGVLDAEERLSVLQSLQREGR